MNTIRKAGIFALVGLLAFAWVKLDSNADARTPPTTRDIDVECNVSRSCTMDPTMLFPVGDGLFVMMFEDFF